MDTSSRKPSPPSLPPQNLNPNPAELPTQPPLSPQSAPTQVQPPSQSPKVSQKTILIGALSLILLVGGIFTVKHQLHKKEIASELRVEVSLMADATAKRDAAIVVFKDERWTQSPATLASKGGAMAPIGQWVGNAGNAQEVYLGELKRYVPPSVSEVRQLHEDLVDIEKKRFASILAYYKALYGGKETVTEGSGRYAIQYQVPVPDPQAQRQALADYKEADDAHADWLEERDQLAKSVGVTLPSK